MASPIRPVCFAIVLSVVLVSATARAGEARVVVPGQCPGKFCSFGPWVLEEDTTLRASPSTAAPVVAILPTGATVIIVTGEVHAIPGVFHVHEPHGAYRPGDALRVLSYVGGGEWLIEFGGKRYAETLGFSPWGGFPGRRCEVREHCWGTLEERFDWLWWAQIETQDGTRGWSKRWGKE